MYHMIRYDTLYRTINEHLRYDIMIRNFFYTQYDIYRVAYDTDSYMCLCLYQNSTLHEPHLQLYFYVI